MLTGELRNKIDQLWNAFWSGGIANPLEVIKQITYLLFLRSLHQSGVPAAQSAFAHPMRDALHHRRSPTSPLRGRTAYLRRRRWMNCLKCWMR